ncbi:MAG: hypothetical protein JWR07_2836 [Nevskia sp.]|nr:hypothetical protein [Nevskia sp.]
MPIQCRASGRAPILVAAYLTDAAAPIAERSGALTKEGRIIAAWHSNS